MARSDLRLESARVLFLRILGGESQEFLLLLLGLKHRFGFFERVLRLVLCCLRDEAVQQVDLTDGIRIETVMKFP